MPAIPWITTLLWLFLGSSIFQTAAIVTAPEPPITCRDEPDAPRGSRPNEIIDDCIAASRLMPYRAFNTDAHTMTCENRPTIALAGRERVVGPNRVRLPAAFSVGSCFIRVTYRHRSQARAPEDTKLASLLYFYLWPRVQSGVTQILKECAQGNDQMGFGGSSVKSGDWSLHYLFSVTTRPKEWDGRNYDYGQWEYGPWEDFNVYTRDGQTNDLKPSRALQQP